jgi:hypothetical protein
VCENKLVLTGFVCVCVCVCMHVCVCVCVKLSILLFTGNNAIRPNRMVLSQWNWPDSFKCCLFCSAIPYGPWFGVLHTRHLHCWRWRYATVHLGFLQLQ